MSATWRAVVPPRAGAARVDPYWRWARATGFAWLGGAGPRAEPWMPVLLELHEPVRAAAPRLSRSIGRIADLHLAPVRGLDAVRHCTARVTEAFFDRARNPWLDRVVRFELGMPVLDAPAASVLPVARAPVRPLRGDGAGTPLLLVIDDALPVVHAALADARGEPRCLALWDQDPSVGPTPPALPSGRLLHRAAIAAALDGARRGAVVDEARAADALALRDRRRRWTHGSAVLGLAAGASPHGAPAYLGVQLPRRAVDDTSGLSLGVHALEALRFGLVAADGLAAGARAPLVANLSYGRFAGAHDGSGPLASAIDELLALRNAAGHPFAVVLPAGNGQLSRGHARLRVPAGGRTTLDWRIHPDDRTPSFVELWPDRGDAGSLTVALSPPSGGAGPAVAPGEVHALGAGADALATVAGFAHGAAGDAPMALVAVAPTAAHERARRVAPAGIWRLTLVNRGTVDVEVDAWIQRDDAFGASRLAGRQSRFEDPAYVRVDERGAPRDLDPPGGAARVRRTATLNPIATGRHAVVAGARAADGAVARYSASGRSAGRGTGAVRAPDATALVELGTAAPGRPTMGTTSGSVASASGTSLAAPALARWLLDGLATADPAVRPLDPGWARRRVAEALGVPDAPRGMRGERAALPPG